MAPSGIAQVHPILQLIASMLLRMLEKECRSSFAVNSILHLRNMNAYRQCIPSKRTSGLSSHAFLEHGDLISTISSETVTSSNEWNMSQLHRTGGEKSCTVARDSLDTQSHSVPNTLSSRYMPTGCAPIPHRSTAVNHPGSAE